MQNCLPPGFLNGEAFIITGCLGSLSKKEEEEETYWIKTTGSSMTEMHFQTEMCNHCCHFVLPLRELSQKRPGGHSSEQSEQKKSNVHPFDFLIVPFLGKFLIFLYQS